MIKSFLEFTIAPEVLDLGLVGNFFVMSGLHNQKTDAGFAAYRQEILDQLREEYSRMATVARDPVLQGFRDLHTKVGRSNKKFVSSPENLIAMLLRNGSIPSINLVVDIYNLVSLQTRLALGAHDVDKITGNVILKLTDGTEKFLPLGKTVYEPVSAGEYGYVDDSNEIICRLEYRQVEKTKVTLETANCFFIVQGNATTPPEYISSARSDLITMLKQYCGGQERILC